MKTLLLATATLAAFAAAPALAQDGVGSIGVTYSNTSVDVAGLDGELESANIDAAIATPLTAGFTLTLDGDFNYNIDDPFGGDDSAVGGRFHVSKELGSVRVGGFAGGSEVYGEQLWSFGGEGQYYMGNVTLTGSVAYETLESTDLEGWSVGGDAAYFISPNFRVNGGAGWTTIDAGAVDTDGWQANVGGEYQFTGTGISLTAGYTHGELEDLDMSIDTVSVGLRFSFGGDLQTRERAGGDLGRTAAGVGALAAGLI